MIPACPYFIASAFLSGKELHPIIINNMPTKNITFFILFPFLPAPYNFDRDFEAFFERQKNQTLDIPIEDPVYLFQKLFTV